MALTAGSESVDLYYGVRPIKQVTVGKTVVWQRTPEKKIVTKTGSVSVPKWATKVDIIALGGGGGGAQGDGAFLGSGNGGKSGKWAGITLPVSDKNTIRVAIGRGGVGQPKYGRWKNQGTGENTIVSIDNVQKLVAEGGSSGVGVNGIAGQPAGTFTLGDKTATGSTASTPTDKAGGLGSGGGGGSGGTFGRRSPGRDGGPGAVWLWFRSF